MNAIAMASVCAVALAIGVGAAPGGQSTNAAVDAHREAAKAAAGSDFADAFSRVCASAVPPAGAGTQTPAARQAGPPERATWHAEPAKVFDNLYFFGQTEYSVWAVTTSAGVIVVDTIYDYSVEDEVVGGMRTLGLDPAQIKYAIVSHGHSDHSGGAKYLQDHFGTRVILSAADWDLLDRSNGTRPKRDMIATDGQKLTLGDTTLTMYLTPGHTLGTISTIIPVKDNGQPHVAAVWGGTLFNWVTNRAAYITPDRPDRFWFQTYSTSARRFKELASQAGADVLLSNHTIYDGSKVKLPALQNRKASQPHPYVIGKSGVQRYLTMVDECAQSGLARISRSQ